MNRMVNGNPEITEITKSPSGYETLVVGGSDLQGNEEIFSRGKKKRIKNQKKRLKSLQNNVTDNPLVEDTLLKNAPFEEKSIMEPIADAKDSNKRKHKVLHSDDKHNDRLEGTISKKKTRRKKNLSPLPLVSTHLTENSEMVNNDVEASLHQQIDMGKEKIEIYTSVENSCTQDILEGDARPNIDVNKVDVNSASEIAEKLSSLQDGAVNGSMTKLDTYVKDVALVEASIPIDKKKETSGSLNRKRRKIEKAARKKVVSVEEGSSSSAVVKDIAEIKKIGHLNEALPSLCAGLMSEREDLSERGTSMPIVEDNSVKPVSKNSKKKIELETSGEAINEINLLKDVSLEDVPEENSDPSQRSKVDALQNVEENVCTVEASDDPDMDSSMKLLKKNENADSHLQLGVIQEDASPVVIKENNPLPVLQSSPERALANLGKKKLLILDVNGLLVDIVSFPSNLYQPDTVIGGKSVFKRPFCDSFLEFCMERFDVGVWTSRTKKNVDAVLKFLLGNSKSNLIFCWDQYHCTQTGYKTIENREKPLLLKELKKLWEKYDQDLPWEKGAYNESNTLLLDDSPYKALLNPPNSGIFPFSYGYMDIKDNALAPLGDLRIYLEKVALAENVQEFVKQNPFGQRPITERNVSWGFYSKVIGAMSSQQKGRTNRWSSASWGL